jgi:hypothetical protein
MKNRKMLLPALLSIALVCSLILPASVAGDSAAVPRPDDRSISYLVVGSPSAAPAMALNTPQGNVTPMVAARGVQTVGLKSDGTVVAVGNNYYGQCNVGGWTSIVQVAVGYMHTVGLKSDGTVIAVGDNEYGQCDVGDWENITQVAAGWGHTVGLKSNGTVVAVGYNDYGQCNASNWIAITQVATGNGHTVGLKSDGTVVAVGWNSDGRCDVGNWTGIIQITGGWGHTVGLKADGTVVAVGDNEYGQCDVGNWTNIVQVAASYYHTVGLKSDGTVVAVGYDDYGQCNVGGWGNITQVAAGEEHTVGLKSDGSVIAVGDNEDGQCNLSDWNLVLALPPSQKVQVGIKAGAWIKIEYKITGWPAGQPYPEWLKLEFLSVEGTIANVRVTMHMSDGTEQSDTVPVDVVSGGEVPGLSGGIISANLTTGDSVYMSGFGNVTIKGETTRIYAGARRTVVYTSISQSIPYQGEVQLSYYWDKLTGVLVEASTTSSGITATAKATETNMWEAAPPAVGMAWWLWAIVAAAIVALAIVVYRLKKRKTPTAPTLPTEGT